MAERRRHHRRPQRVVDPRGIADAEPGKKRAAVARKRVGAGDERRPEFVEPPIEASHTSLDRDRSRRVEERGEVTAAFRRSEPTRDAHPVVDARESGRRAEGQTGDEYRHAHRLLPAPHLDGRRQHAGLPRRGRGPRRHRAVQHHRHRPIENGGCPERLLHRRHLGDRGERHQAERDERERRGQP